MELERPREQATTAAARPTRLELGPAPLPPDWSSIGVQNGGADAVGGVVEPRQRQDSGQWRAQQVRSLADSGGAS